MSPDEEDPVVVLDPEDPLFAVECARSGDGFRPEFPVNRGSNQPLSSLPGIPAPMAEYLCSRGVTDPATWAAFRLGEVAAPLQRRQRQPRRLNPHPESRDTYEVNDHEAHH